MKNKACCSIDSIVLSGMIRLVIHTVYSFLIRYLQPHLQAAKFSGFDCETVDQWLCLHPLFVTSYNINGGYYLFIDALVITNIIVLPRSIWMQSPLVPA
jgi:hypothetical protein